MFVQAFLQGLAVCGGLIMAIGAQNAHVLRMGLTRQHLGITLILCVLSDGLLIGLGVIGAGALITRWPLALDVATWGGAAFLLWYGFNSLRAAFRRRQMEVASQNKRITQREAILLLLAFTYLNPHTYLDAIVLIGSLGARHPEAARLPFWVGCVTASALWFTVLAYGARWLAPLFTRPLSWRVLDGLIGLSMTVLALNLVR